MYILQIYSQNLQEYIICINMSFHDSTSAAQPAVQGQTMCQRLPLAVEGGMDKEQRKEWSYKYIPMINLGSRLLADLPD